MTDLSSAPTTTHTGAANGSGAAQSSTAPAGQASGANQPVSAGPTVQRGSDGPAPATGAVGAVGAGPHLPPEDAADFNDAIKSMAYRDPLHRDPQPAGPPPEAGPADVTRGVANANDAAVQLQQSQGVMGTDPLANGLKTGNDIVQTAQGLNEVMQPGRASASSLGKLVVNGAGVVAPRVADMIAPGSGDMLGTAMDMAKTYGNAVLPGGTEHWVGDKIAKVRDFVLGPSEAQQQQAAALKQQDTDLGQLQEIHAENMREQRAREPLSRFELDRRQAATLAKLDAADPQGR